MNDSSNSDIRMNQMMEGPVIYMPLDGLLPRFSPICHHLGSGILQAKSNYSASFGIMNAATASVKQIELYRNMTGEQRLAIALELHELSCEIAREGIRQQNPNADSAEVERLLHRRLELVRAA